MSKESAFLSKKDDVKTTYVSLDEFNGRELEILQLKQQLLQMRSHLEWAVDIANYWVDNIGDKKICCELEYKYDLKIDHSDD